MRTFLVWLQAATFVALGIVLFTQRESRLAVAQVLLAAVTAVVYL